MAINFELTSISPGHGRLVIRNFAAEGELQFNFLRPDSYYLGPDLNWQPTVHWHEVGGVMAEGNDCSCLLGPHIIDGLLLSSSRGNIRVSVQGGGNSGVGMMRIIGRLLGSRAAGSSTEAVSMSRADDGRAGMVTGLEVPETVEEATASTESPPSPLVSSPSAGDSGKRWLWMLLAVLILLAAITSAWYFGLLKFPGSLGNGGFADPVTTDEAIVADGPPDNTTTSALKGRPRAQLYLSGASHPTPQAMFDQANDWERESDCEAAMIVYQVAAQSDAEVAARYAYLYDPDTFKASGCIKYADPETAAYWYEAPAGAGDVNAQRQLGKILVESNDSGALRDQGEAWLGRAAKAGDSEASALLEKLGIGGD